MGIFRVHVHGAEGYCRTYIGVAKTAQEAIAKSLRLAAKDDLKSAHVRDVEYVSDKQF